MFRALGIPAKGEGNLISVIMIVFTSTFALTVLIITLPHLT